MSLEPQALSDFHRWLTGHIFTPSELEAYQLCPFRFYAQAVLKLRAEVRNEVEMTPPETGRLLHTVLEKLLRDSPVTRERSEELLAREMTVFRKDRPLLSPVLLELHQKRIQRTLDSFIEDFEEERTRQRSLTPRHFEWSFGVETDPLIIPNPGGDPIRLRGRIDRIDIDERQKRFLAIDYKTGSTKITGNQIKRGEALQLPLYVLAVGRLLLPGYEPIGGVYYQLSDMTMKDGILHAERLPEFIELHPRSSSLVPATKWDGIFEGIEEKVRTIVTEIHKGEFPSHPEPCDPYCPYRDLCRIRADR